MATIRKANDHSDWRFRTAGFEQGGVLWDVESDAPRYSVFAWLSPSKIWHVLHPANFQPLSEGQTRAEAIRKYESTFHRNAARSALTRADL